jgi:prephenate dehydrogenase
MNFEQITIVGPGLLGASLAMALRTGNLCERTVIWGRSQSRVDECAMHSWCDRVETNIGSAVSGSALVVLCTSVDSISALLPEVMSCAGEGAIVTDVGSVKEEICRVGSTETEVSRATFIGSHPMAGSEKSGMQNAKEDLFKGKPCIITPLSNSTDSNVRRLYSFWEEVGMKVHAMLPSEHDRCVASVSHLPHLLASSLAHCLGAAPENWKEIAGQGLRDTTRIAEGSPELWEQILLSNKPNLLSALELFEKSIALAKKCLQQESKRELNDFLDEGARYRRSLGLKKE